MQVKLRAEWFQSEFSFIKAFGVRVALFRADICGWSGNE